MNLPEGANLTLSDGWEMLVIEQGSYADGPPSSEAGAWIKARVPGTAISNLREAGCHDSLLLENLHAHDVWWRCQIDGQGVYRLELDGFATLAEIWLDERMLGQSRSMFVPFACQIELAGPSRLYLCARALTDTLKRKLPRARWRTRLVSSAGLRGVRTTLLGQVESFMHKRDVVGPWRAVRLVDVEKVSFSQVSVLAELDASGFGRLQVSLRATAARYVKVHCGGAEAELDAHGDGVFEIDFLIGPVDPWWPHTHGTPVLYDLNFEIDSRSIPYGKIGFRRLEVDRGRDGMGFGLIVNGQRVFARGACWVSADMEGLAHDEALYRPLLEAAKAAGLNLIRLTGIGVYEDRLFFDLCDAMGIMVWQDFMFANFDYPMDDEAFVELVRAEADAFLIRTRGSASLVVLCGGSEMLQQAAMMGVPVDKCRSRLIDEVLPQAANRWRPETLFVENSPCGGALPFYTDTGISHYYGVGAYLRPVEDARRANVRFTTECLAFSNLPNLETHRTKLNGAMPGVDDWRGFVPRDAGADWDFEDVRDYYLGVFIGEDPNALKVRDPVLYHDLSCEAVNDLVTRTYWEWRRQESSCAGALVWLFQDLVPGAGWGLLDEGGRPKAIYYALKRVWQSVHLGLTDEGLNGIDIHIANECPVDQRFDLEFLIWRADGTKIVRRTRALILVAREMVTIRAVELIGSFFDLTHAYRFGARAHDGVTVNLRDGEDGRLITSATYYPPGADYVPPTELNVTLSWEGSTESFLDISCDAPVRGLFIDVPGWWPSDDGFDLYPGGSMRVVLTAQTGDLVAPVGSVRSRGACLARIAPIGQLG